MIHIMFILNKYLNVIQVFATDRSHYAGQAVGLIVAKSRGLAVGASKLVTITYSDKMKPVVNIKEGIKMGRGTSSLNFDTGGKMEREFKEGSAAGNLVLVNKFVLT